MKLSLIPALLVGISFLHGCEAGTTVLSQNDAGITLAISNGLKSSYQKVYDDANAHCAQRGKSALLILKGKYEFIFECR